MPERPIDALLLETLGARLLAYLLNVEETQIESRFASNEPLDDAVEAVIQNLLPLAARVAHQRQQHPGAPVGTYLDLGACPPGQDVALGNLIRLASGGLIAMPAEALDIGSDDVKVTLCRMAADVYPQLLLPVDGPWHRVFFSLWMHPMRVTLEDAVNADRTLASLYPSVDESLGRRGAMVSSLGRGGTIQSVAFGETVIGAAWDLIEMTVPQPTLADLYSSICTEVDTLRAALARKATTVPASLAFTGVTTGGRSIDTPWGTLRPVKEHERRAAPAVLQGAVGGVGADGLEMTVSYAGELVLVTELPYTLETFPWDPGDELPGWPDGRKFAAVEHLRRIVECVELAVLLGVERSAEQWATARPTWQWTHDPMAFGRLMSWSDAKTAPAFMPTELTPDECDAVGRWCFRIDAAWSKRIDIAVRRTLSAARTRADPADRLVDSVIAWENLFGTSEGEPRLRISVAMAWLLGHDTEERGRLQREIRSLYDDRSKIVHGAQFDERAIGERANRALELARASLQRLFEERPDVLALNDGAARSITLMLGPADAPGGDA